MADHMSFVDFYRSFVSSIPQENGALLSTLCALLHTLHTASKSPLPSSVSAVIFGPIVVPEGQTDHQNGLASVTETTPMVCESLQMLIEQYPLIFLT